MEDNDKAKILKKFLKNSACEEIPELKDCAQLREQYNKQLKVPGCTPCKKKALSKKFKTLIYSRLV